MSRPIDVRTTRVLPMVGMASSAVSISNAVAKAEIGPDVASPNVSLNTPQCGCTPVTAAETTTPEEAVVVIRAASPSTSSNCKKNVVPPDEQIGDVPRADDTTVIEPAPKPVAPELRNAPSALIVVTPGIALLVCHVFVIADT